MDMEYLAALGVILAMIPGILGFLKLRNYISNLELSGEDMPNDFKNKSTVSLSIMFTGVVYAAVIGILFEIDNASSEFFYIPFYMGILAFFTNLGRYIWVDKLFDLLRRKDVMFGRILLFIVTFETNLVFSLVISLMLWRAYFDPYTNSYPSIPISYYVFLVVPLGYSLMIVSAIVQGLVTRKVLKDKDALGKNFGISILKTTIPQILSIIGLIYIIISLIPVISYTAEEYLQILNLLLKSFH